MNYTEAMEYIELLNKSGIVPGLGRVRELCRRLGNPQEELSIIHIAGTNGKGSTLAFLSTILKAAGYKVGRYISPTIFEYRERIQVNEKMISQKAFCEGVELIKEIAEQMEAEGIGRPSSFEAETALAFWYFREKKCQLVVLETGLGGLEDATNIITKPLVSVLASISMDHMNFLGDSLEKIAGQKAGIIKEKCPVVALSGKPEVMKVIEKQASAMGSSLYIADPSLAVKVSHKIPYQTFDYEGFKRLKISLLGSYQIDNAILALKTIEVLNEQGFKVSEEKIRQGLEETIWPGRFMLLDKKPFIFADGAHNQDAAIRLMETVEYYFTNKRIIYIMGMLRDKEYEKVVDITCRRADLIFTVQTPGNPRSLSAYDLAKSVSQVNSRVTSMDSVSEALEAAKMVAGPEDVILAFGSLSFLGEFITCATKSSKKRA